MVLELAPKRAGIVDVAKMAGVSRQTVTRAVNDMPGISADTKSRVLDAARTLGYRPSRFGRGLVKHNTLSLGLVITDLTNPYFADLASSIAKLATEHGWALLLMENAPNNKASIARLRELSLQVDAAIGYFETDPDTVEDIFGDMPLVTLNDEFRPGGHASVDIDFDPGMMRILEHLRSTGRHNVVMVDEPEDGRPSSRAESYVRQSIETGLEPEIFSADVDGLAHMQIGVTVADQLLKRENLPDAVICYNDAVAIGVLKQFQLAGIVVPRDCGIVGIDGLAIGTLVTPELTTLSLDISEVAASAVEMVVTMLGNPHSTSGQNLRRTVTHSVVLRGSA